MRSPTLTLYGALAVAALLTLAIFFVANSAHAQDPSLRYGGQIPPEVDTIYEHGLAWLVANQAQDGSWPGNNQGPGVTGICLMAFLASGEDPNYGRYAATIRRAIRNIIQQQDATTGYLPSSMYHLGFGMLALSEAYGTVDESLVWQGDKRCAASRRRSTSPSAVPPPRRRKTNSAAGAIRPTPRTPTCP